MHEANRGPDRHPASESVAACDLLFLTSSSEALPCDVDCWSPPYVWALPAFSVCADPIRITGGSLDMPDPALVGGPLGILDIRGFDGFHLIARGDARNGFWASVSPVRRRETSLSLAGSLQAGGFLRDT